MIKVKVRNKVVLNIELLGNCPFSLKYLVKALRDPKFHVKIVPQPNNETFY